MLAVPRGIRRLFSGATARGRSDVWHWFLAGASQCKMETHSPLHVRSGLLEFRRRGDILSFAYAAGRGKLTVFNSEA